MLTASCPTRHTKTKDIARYRCYPELGMHLKAAPQININWSRIRLKIKEIKRIQQVYEMQADVSNCQSFCFARVASRQGPPDQPETMRPQGLFMFISFNI